MRRDRIPSYIAARLRGRREEIEEQIMTRVGSVADPAASDPEYQEGLRAAVTAALEYGVAVVECGEEHAPSIPTILLLQARFAARIGVNLDTIVRRYLVGYTLLGNCLIGESQMTGLETTSLLQELMRDQAAAFDRLLAAVVDEYTQEATRCRAVSTERRTERVRRLLAGDLLDTTDFAYEFGYFHLGLVGAGTGVDEVIRDLAGDLSRLLLLARPTEGTVWAWLGGESPIDPAEILTVLADSGAADVFLASGEPSAGLAGWRLTHRQAKAAMSIALRKGEKVVRYADVALAATSSRDDLIVTSLRNLYLDPLCDGKDGGEVARVTLRAYFAAERNVSSAAAALGITRRTVFNRLRNIEKKIGRPLNMIATELEVALRLDELADPPGHPEAPVETRVSLEQPNS